MYVSGNECVIDAALNGKNRKIVETVSQFVRSLRLLHSLSSYFLF